MKIKGIEGRKVALNLLGSAILAFGIYNIHSITIITEGGILGLNLLVQHWLGITPAITNMVATLICYFVGWKTLGKEFLIYSGIAVLGFSVFYGILELFPRVWPEIAEMPLLCAIVGGIFVGVGAGLCVICDGAPSGDDALAMSISAKLKVKIQWVYLVTDLAVLAASLSYIPFSDIFYSIITVVLSGQIIGLMMKVVNKS